MHYFDFKFGICMNSHLISVGYKFIDGQIHLSIDSCMNNSKYAFKTLSSNQYTSSIQWWRFWYCGKSVGISEFYWIVPTKNYFHRVYFQKIPMLNFYAVQFCVARLCITEINPIFIPVHSNVTGHLNFTTLI